MRAFVAEIRRLERVARVLAWHNKPRHIAGTAHGLFRPTLFTASFRLGSNQKLLNRLLGMGATLLGVVLACCFDLCRVAEVFFVEFLAVGLLF